MSKTPDLRTNKERIPQPLSFPHAVRTQPTIGRRPARRGCPDQAIAAYGGDAREAVKALIVANH
jgi:hypothetical protein